MYAEKLTMRIRSIMPILTIAGMCCLCAPVFAQGTTHVVGPNETVYSISREYRIDPSALLRANHISDPRLLQIGAVLTIPGKADAGTTYTVQSGDTLYGIAHNNGISLEKLVSFNHLDPLHVLQVGETLRIPGASGSTANFVSVAGLSGGQKNPPPMKASDPDELALSGHGPPTSDIGTFHMKAPQLPISIQTAPVDSGSKGSWPLPGTRYILAGKFPGIMIRGKPGDSVVAVAPGRVIYTGPYTTFGRVVFVQSAAGFVYIYGGNEHVSVAPGDKVKAGDTVGTLGTTPFESGAQLYFSVWKNNRFVNPNDAPRG